MITLLRKQRTAYQTKPMKRTNHLGEIDGILQKISAKFLAVPYDNRTKSMLRGKRRISGVCPYYGSHFAGPGHAGRRITVIQPNNRVWLRNGKDRNTVEQRV